MYNMFNYKIPAVCPNDEWDHYVEFEEVVEITNKGRLSNILGNIFNRLFN